MSQLKRISGRMIHAMECLTHPSVEYMNLYLLCLSLCADLFIFVRI